MGKFKTVVWDMDGTILNTLDDLLTSMNHVLSAHSMQTRIRDEARKFVGNGLRVYTEKSVPFGTSEKDVNEVLKDFTEYYGEHCEDTTAPYPGIIDTMKKLNELGVKQAIVSNKIDSAVKVLNEKFFPGLIPVAIGERLDIQKKPAPDAVLEALKELDSSVDEAVYIGDSDVDLMTAENAGLPCISVLWGFRTKEELEAAGAKNLVETPEEILKEYFS